MKIEILGIGGTLCKSLFSNALEALRESGRQGSVVAVRDIRRIMKYGALASPVLIINGMVMLSGKLASPDEIMALLQKHMTPFF